MILFFERNCFYAFTRPDRQVEACW